MKVNKEDFRLGNFVYYQDKLQRIIYNDFPLIGVRNKDYRHVDLTPEWLTMFGFGESMSKGNWWIEKETEEMVIHMHVRVDERTNKIFYQVVYLSEEPIFIEVCELKTVHQLQNLFFDLYGEELEVKEENL